MKAGRRQFLKAGSVTIAAAGCSTVGGPPGARRNYVLVHGAWHGGWCWARVTPQLRAAGHDVHVITLTGLGDRAHLNSPDITLEPHIADVLGFLEMEDLRDVALVGHSYAGMMVTAVADRARPRLKSLVYLDAFLPENGAALIDYVAPARRAGLMKSGTESGYMDPVPLKAFGVTDPKDLAWAQPRIRKQSFKTATQPIRFSNDNPHLRMPRTYVYCSNPPTGSFDQFAAKVRNDPGWKFVELKTGHDCMIIAPHEVTKILLEAA